jgi:protein phosphatase 1G
VQNHFTKELLNLKNFKNGNYKAALADNFLRMDDAMVEPAAKQEIRIEAKKSKEDDDKQSKTQKNSEKNKQLELYQQLMDPKSREDADISMNTGCTACVCFIDGNKLYCSNAGDSRAIVCKKGVAYPVSIDHKPDMESEKKRIYKAEGWVSDGRVKGIK